MENKSKKLKNRIFSFICLGVFCVSLVVAGVAVTKITSLYKENETLEATKVKMIDEQNYLKSQNDYLKDDDYLNVYFDGTYTGYDSDDTLIIIKK